MSTEITLHTPDHASPIAMAMTGAAFDAAQHKGITAIEPDIDAMAYIAREIGATNGHNQLPPLVLVARDGMPQRNLIGGWGSRLPTHSGAPQTGRYFPANELHEQAPRTCSRDTLLQQTSSHI